MSGALKSVLLFTAALSGASLFGPAQAQTSGGGQGASDTTDIETVIVTSERTTQSSVEIAGVQAQKLLPGISPLKAIDSLPGVIFETADPWGNNEQNEAFFVHGFATQQLGYTMDGVPLGDQQYGNYNGLSPSRALTSENVARVSLSSGTGSLGVASTSNLGGAIETFSSDPSQTQRIDARETLGSYDTTRTFLRFDTGDLGDGNAAYVSYLHQDARAWDFDGHQRGDQVNLKYVHDGAAGKLTVFADWDNKVEPNEDATSFLGQQTGPAQGFTPYTRPFLFPNYAAALANLTNGTPPSSQGNNFSNYFSAAQREDFLTYVNYDWRLDDNITWSNQAYFHHDDGRGIVAGPINQAGLPGLFAIYYPSLVVGGSTTSAGTLANIVNQFGGTGYEVRTTEYRINRGGERSTLTWDLGDHQIEAGAWYEHNTSSTARWYPMSAANDDLTPYEIPRNPNFTQYYFELATDDVQLHLQDQWRILPDLLLQAGVKASLQTASDKLPVQQQNLQAGNPYGLPATNPQVNYPVGSITSNNWFLPQAGAIWDVTDNDQVFVNIQKNLRQYIPYGAGSNFFGTSPWSLGSQAAFDTFKATGHPETSWTYEAGVRGHRDVDLGPLTGIEGQANYYHVDFSNRVFNIANYNFINPNPGILVNVGGVTANGVDAAATLHFGEHFQLYDAISYNESLYDTDYVTQVTVGGVPTNVTVPISGKQEPLVPHWLNKFIASVNYGPFEAQLSGNYIARRFVTYTDDVSVGSTFMTDLEASFNIDLPADNVLKGLKISGNITNLANITGVSTAVVTSAGLTTPTFPISGGGYQAYPIPPRMFFLTVGAAL
jgi:outer membrane receptor protein involved in Fe transport